MTRIRVDEPEELSRAVVLESLDALDAQAFGFIAASLYALTCSLVIEEPTRDACALKETLRTYLDERQIVVPF